MNLLRPSNRRLQPWFALALGLGSLATWTKILDQYNYRAPFSWWQMYLPVVLVPLAVVAVLLRAAWDGGMPRFLSKHANSLMAMIRPHCTVY